MTVSLDEATELAMRLDTPDRVRLCQMLAESVDVEIEKSISLDPAWIKVAEERLAELRQNPARAIPLHQAMATVRKCINP